MVRSKQPGTRLLVKNDHRVQEKPVTDLSQEINRKTRVEKKGKGLEIRQERNVKKENN